MSDGAAGGPVERAHDAASRGEWQVAFDLFQEADADGQVGVADLPVLADVAYASGHLDVTIETWERAYAGADGRRRDRSPRRAPPCGSRCTCCSTPPSWRRCAAGWRRAEQLLDEDGGTPAHAWFAVVRSYERMLSGDRHERPAVGAPRHRGRLDVRRRGRRHRPGRGGAPARSSTATSSSGLALLDEAGMAATSGDLDPLSTGVVYCELVCALQGLAQYDLAEEWTEAMERWSPHQRHRQPPRPVPGASRRDPAAAGTLPRGRGRGAPGLRGAAALPSPRARMAAQRARPHPAAHGRRRRRGGGVPGRPPGRLGSATGPRAGAPRRGRRRGRGSVDPRRARAPVVGAVEGAAAEHRSAAGAAARRAGRDRRRRRRPRRGAGRRRRARHHRRPLPEQGAGRVGCAHAEHGCDSPTATPATRGAPVLRSRRGSGARSARPTRPRSPASASPTRAAHAATSTAPTSRNGAAARSSNGSQPVLPPTPPSRWRRAAGGPTARAQRVPARGRLLVGDLRGADTSGP